MQVPYLHPARRVDIGYVIQDLNVFHDLFIVLFGKFIRLRIKPDRGKAQRFNTQGVALSGTYKRLLQLLLLIGFSALAGFFLKAASSLELNSRYKAFSSERPFI